MTTRNKLNLVLGMMMAMAGGMGVSNQPRTAKAAPYSYSGPTGRRYRNKPDRPKGTRLQRLAAKGALAVRHPQGLRTKQDKNQPSGFVIKSYGY